ncbi:unnamed protein product [Brassica oleracea]
MYCVKKSELLDLESEDPAVRLALGETKVISETKEAFAKAGVNVTSLEEFATEKELAQMFGKFGRLDKIILPPTKTMVLSNVLYVKSLSFETTEDGLKMIIKHVKKGKCLSTGYRFVEFDSIETATSVYRDLRETVLDGTV